MRTIRTNDTTNGGISAASGAAGAGGLTTAQVQSEIDTKLSSNGIYQLVSSTDYVNGFDSSTNILELISNMDYDTISSYLFEIRNPGHSSGGRYNLQLMKGGSQMTSTTYYGWGGLQNSAIPYSNTSVSNGQLNICPANNNVYQNSDEWCLLRLEYFLNDPSDSESDSRYTQFTFDMHPQSHNMQGASTHIKFALYNASNRPDALELRLSSGQWGSAQHGISNLTVYQKKRPTATTA